MAMSFQSREECLQHSCYRERRRKKKKKKASAHLDRESIKAEEWGEEGGMDG